MGMIGNSLAQGLISGANIQDGTVDTPDIKDSAVTAAKIASDAVITAKILDANVTSAKLATGAATGTKLGSDVVVTSTDQTIGGLKTFAGAPGAYGALAILSNTTATTSNTSYGGVRFSSAPGLDWHAGKKNVNTASYFVLRDDTSEWLNVSTAGLFALNGNAKVMNNSSTDQPVFGGNWQGTNYWGIGHFGSSQHVIRIGERDVSGAWITQPADISLYIGNSLANTRANTRTYMAFDASQPDGSYGTWQKIVSASDTGYAAFSGSWSLAANGDTIIPEDGRYLVTYASGGDGNDTNYARVIIGINHSRGGSDLNSYSAFRNQFGTFTNPNSVYSGYSDGTHTVTISQVYRCLAGDGLQFWGQGDLNSAFNVRVSITKIGEL